MCVYIYIHIYIYVCVCVCVCEYMYIGVNPAGLPNRFTGPRQRAVRNGRPAT